MINRKPAALVLATGSCSLGSNLAHEDATREALPAGITGGHLSRRIHHVCDGRPALAHCGPLIQWKNASQGWRDQPVEVRPRPRIRPPLLNHN
jgi:hypothetical protein